jgi:hypothetical protein
VLAVNKKAEISTKRNKYKIDIGAALHIEYMEE